MDLDTIWTIPKMLDFKKIHSELGRQNIEKIIEKIKDATEGEFVKVKTKELIKNKWKTTTKNYKIDEYYKN